MKSNLWFLVLLSIAYLTACSAPPPATADPDIAHTATSSPVAPMTQTLEPTLTRTPFPTATPIVVEGVGQTVQTVRLPNQGYMFPAFGAASVWIPSPGLLMRIDPVTGHVAAEIPLDGGQREHINTVLAEGKMYAVTAQGDVIWASEANGEAVVRIDPQTNEIIDHISLDARPDAMALEDGTLWVAHRTGDEVLRVNTQTKEVIARIPVYDPDSIAIGAGSAWVVGARAENLVRIDPMTNSIIATISLGTGNDPAGQVAFGEGDVWVTKFFGGTVTRVNPETNQVVATIEIGIPVISVEVGAGAVWATVGIFDTCENSGVVRIDPATKTVVGRLPVRCAEDLVASPEGFWVTSYKYPEITLIRPEQ